MDDFPYIPLYPNEELAFTAGTYNAELTEEGLYLPKQVFDVYVAFMPEEQDHNVYTFLQTMADNRSILTKDLGWDHPDQVIKATMSLCDLLGVGSEESEGPDILDGDYEVLVGEEMADGTQVHYLHEESVQEEIFTPKIIRAFSIEDLYLRSGESKAFVRWFERLPYIGNLK